MSLFYSHLEYGKGLAWVLDIEPPNWDAFDVKDWWTKIALA
jgi:hypothetical protein